MSIQKKFADENTRYPNTWNVAIDWFLEHDLDVHVLELSKVFNWHNLDTTQFSVSIHERNIEILATEMFKISKNLAARQMHEIFE